MAVVGLINWLVVVGFCFWHSFPLTPARTSPSAARHPRKLSARPKRSLSSHVGLSNPGPSTPCGWNCANPGKKACFRSSQAWLCVPDSVSPALWSESRSVMSDPLPPRGLYSPWNSPGQNTGVGSVPFSRGSFQPRVRTQVSHIAGGYFTSWTTKEVP